MRVLTNTTNSAASKFNSDIVKDCKKAYVLSGRSVEMVENAKHEWRYRSVATFVPSKLYYAIKEDPYLSQFLMGTKLSKEWPAMIYPESFCYVGPNLKGSLAVTPIYWNEDGRQLTLPQMKKAFMEFFGIPSKKDCINDSPIAEMLMRASDGVQQIYVASHELCDLVDGVATIYPVVVSSLTFATLSAQNAVLTEYEALQFAIFKYGGIPEKATDVLRPHAITVSKAAKNEATLMPEDFMTLYHPYYKDTRWNTIDFERMERRTSEQYRQYNETIEYILRPTPKDLVGARLLSMCPDEIKELVENIQNPPKPRETCKENQDEKEEDEPTYEKYDPFEHAFSLDEAERQAAIRRGELPPDKKGEDDDDDVDTKVLDGPISELIKHMDKEIDTIVREKLGMTFEEIGAIARAAKEKGLICASDAVPTTSDSEHVKITPNASDIVHMMFGSTDKDQKAEQIESGAKLYLHSIDEAQRLSEMEAGAGCIGVEPEIAKADQA